MPAIRLIKAALGATIVVFAVAATYISFVITERQEFLREVSRYNVVWAVSQALSELHRLEISITTFAMPNSRVERDEVELRFDILHNRLTVMNGREIATFTDTDPELKAVVHDLAAALAELEPVVARLGQPGAAEAMLARLSPLDRRLTYLAAAANQYGGDQVAHDQRALIELHWIFSGIAAGLVLCGLVFIGLLLFQHRVIERAHKELRALTDDLHRAKDAAEAASRAKSRFLANISHELRTPLNAIIGFSEMIATETFGAIGQQRYRDYARDILRSGTHMFELVTDILTMAKLDAGHYELALEQVDVAAVVNEVVDMFRGTEMAQHRDIVVEPSAGLPGLYADRRALRQMLLNLLSNASKFSDQAAPVVVGLRHTPSGFELSVSDNGIGMTPEQAALAVQPFHQVDSRMTRKYDGAGLGLSIVKAMIEQHGGSLIIDSRPGVGTRATLAFPARFTESSLAAAA